MPSSNFFRPNGPPALGSPEYTADYNEVKAIGRSTFSTRTPEQTQIALFWADGAGTVTPPGLWNRIAQEVAGNNMRRNARLFALLNALADAAISCWDAKYTYNFWRPVTAIQMGNSDGNPRTEGEPWIDGKPVWLPLIVTPPFPTTPRRTFRLPPHRTACRASNDALEASCKRLVKRRSAECMEEFISGRQMTTVSCRTGDRSVDV